MTDITDIAAFRRKREERRLASSQDHCGIRIGCVDDTVVTELEDIDVELLHTPESAEDFARALWKAASLARAHRHRKSKDPQGVPEGVQTGDRTAPDRTAIEDPE